MKLKKFVFVSWYFFLAKHILKLGLVSYGRGYEFERMQIIYSAMFTGLAAETFLTIVYCAGKHSWSLNTILSTHIMHSLQNFCFLSTFKVEGTCWVAGPTSVKNSSIWLSQLLSHPFIILVNVFVSSNFFLFEN